MDRILLDCHTQNRNYCFWVDTQPTQKENIFKDLHPGQYTELTHEQRKFLIFRFLGVQKKDRNVLQGSILAWFYQIFFAQSNFFYFLDEIARYSNQK